MNAALCCPEPLAGVLPAGGALNLWRAACRTVVARLRMRQAARTAWCELRQLDERSLSEIGVTSGRYWPLDRTNRP
ncbi:MAG: hypothetical protein KGL11_11525 [Alphaproteobacteria bacterium]|nr:hypothetical protein [Alphaproteobacteria bacterium]